MIKNPLKRFFHLFLFLAWEQKARQEGVGLWKDRGMAEVLWILKQRHLLIQVEKVSPDDYRLRIGNWSSTIFHKDEISLKPGATV